MREDVIKSYAFQNIGPNEIMEFVRSFVY